MLKKVRIRILTERTEVAVELYENKTVTPVAEGAAQHSEMSVEGRYHDDGRRVSISYDEGELSGMEGSRVTLSYQKDTPETVSMLRTGSVKTALLFEAGRRHEAVYQTPLAPFTVCVQTARVDNALEAMGKLELDYLVELKGAEAEHTKMKIILSPAYDKPQGM